MMRYETLFKIDSTVTEFDTTYNEEIYQKLSADSAEFVPDIPSAAKCIYRKLSISRKRKYYDDRMGTL
jgi:hypothetical protein